MGMIKNYLLMIQERISEHQFGQDAVEHAINNNLLRITGDIESDVERFARAYGWICEAYREWATRPEQRGIDPICDPTQPVPQNSLTTYGPIHIPRSAGKRRQAPARRPQDRRVDVPAEG